MSWLVWGREIRHGGLDTGGGSSWKPLPIVLTVAFMGTATTNRAFHSRLARELKVPIDEVESVTNHRIIFRSLREPQGGRVFFVGRAKVRRTLAFVGDWRVYRREQISVPLTLRLQGIHNPLRSVTNSLGRVDTR
jgi:hypothetical protein